MSDWKDGVGCGCIILATCLGGGFLLLALGVADALVKHGWPW
jgi:hypothetical protein